jgi:hypothetical protein
MNATRKSCQSGTRSILSNDNLRNGKLTTNSHVTFVSIMRVVSLTSEQFYYTRQQSSVKSRKKEMSSTSCVPLAKKVFSFKYRQLSIFCCCCTPSLCIHRCKAPVLTEKIRPSFSKIVIIFINYFLVKQKNVDYIWKK